MVHFIQTETPIGEIYFINVERVTKLHPMQNGGTAITFDSENTLSVAMDAKEILRRIGADVSVAA